jgi:hypothetical protein
MPLLTELGILSGGGGYNYFAPLELGKRRRVTLDGAGKRLKKSGGMGMIND